MGNIAKCWVIVPIKMYMVDMVGGRHGRWWHGGREFRAEDLHPGGGALADLV